MTFGAVTLSARGGSGSNGFGADDGADGSIGGTGGAGAGGQAGPDCTLCFAGGNGGTGASGGTGGTGGKGGTGGAGGSGAGGAGGTIKLCASVFDASGITVITTGGAGGTGAPTGGSGRVILCSNTNLGTPNLTQAGSQTFITAPQGWNNYVSATTPKIAGIVTGAAISGELAGVTKANVAGLSLAAHENALAAVVRLDNLSIGSYSDIYTGFDAVLFVNLTDGYLPTPSLCVSANYVGCTTVNLPPTLSPNAVWVTLIPEAAFTPAKIKASINASVDPIDVDNYSNTTGLKYIEAKQPATLGPKQVSGINAIAVSPDGNQIYAVDAADGVLFVVNASDLSIRQTFKDGINGVDGLSGVSDVAVNASSLYVASPVESKVSYFSRLDSFGNLGYVRSASETGAKSVTISNDANTVYVAGSAGVAAFNRYLTAETIPTSAASGNNFASISVGSDGTLFAVSESNDTLVMLSSTLGLLDSLSGAANGLDGASAVAVSSDNNYVYVTGKAGNTLALFQRTGNSLALLQVIENGVDGVSGLVAPSDVAVSPDQRFIFVTGQDANAVVVFERYTDPTTTEERLRFAQILRNNVGGVSGLQKPGTLAVSSTQVFSGSFGQGSIRAALASFNNLAALGIMPAPVSLLTSFENIADLTVTTAGGADTILLRTAPKPEVLTTRINTGDSTDTVVIQDASATTIVDLGDDDDTLSLQSDTPNTSVMVYGKAGKDTINVNFVGESTSTEIFGGANDDTVLVKGAHIPDTASVIAHGEAHDLGDTLLFDPEDPTPSTPNYTFGETSYPTGASSASPNLNNGWIQVTGQGYVEYDTFEPIYVIAAPIITFVGSAPVISEGDSVTIQVTVTPLGATNTLKGDVIWDFNGDNAFGDGVGMTVTLTWAQLQGFGINDDGVYQVGVSATNESGFTTEAFVSLTVNNTPPVITITGNATAYVNTPYQLDFSAFDPGDDHIVTWLVDWGDGTSEVFGSSTTLATHTYLLPGLATLIQVSATDEDVTAGNTKSIDILVDAAGVSAGGPYKIAEGQSLSLNASAVGTPTSYSWDVNGDGVFGDATGANPLLTWGQLQGLALNPIQDNGTFNVQVQVSYSGIPAATSNPVLLTVSNTAPTASMTNTGPVDEGSSATVNFVSVSDPSAVDMTGFTYSYDFDNDGIFEQTDIALASFSVPAIYLNDDGTLTVRGLVKDKDGGYAEVFTTITILNVIPTLVVTGASNSVEGSLYSLDLSAVGDPGDDTILYWTVDWGDGMIDILLETAPTAQHVYLDNGSMPITVTAVDDDGTYQDTKTVSVTNVAPILQNLVASLILEGSFSKLSGKIVDPGILDSFTLIVNWGDGSAPDTYNLGAGTVTFVVDHRYIEDDPSGPGPGIYPISVSLSDDDGGSTGGNTTVTVSNAAPVIAGMGLSTNPIHENGKIIFSGSISDAGILDTHTLFVDWGDGTFSNLVVDAISRTFFTSHVYLDDDPTITPQDTYTITAVVIDNDGASNNDNMLVTVENTDPIATNLSLGSPHITGTGIVTLTGHITDLGSLDTHTVDIDWGDGTTSVALVDDITNTFSATHRYLDYIFVHGRRGGYPITITVADDDSGTGTSTIKVPVEYLLESLDALIIPVLSGELVWIDYNGYSTVILRLPEGHQVDFGLHHGNFASLTTLTDATLPGTLPAELSLIYGMDVKLFDDELPVKMTQSPLVVSFVIPEILAKHSLTILFWDETLKNGQGDWVEMSTYYTENGHRINAQITTLGTYILALRNQFTPFDCSNDSATAEMILSLADGSFVQIPCASGAEVSLLPFVNWNLPQTLPEQNAFIFGMRVNIYDNNRALLNTLLPGQPLLVHFLIPATSTEKELTVLYWSGTQWEELETLFTEDENSFWASVESDKPGLFILIEQIRSDP